MGPRLLGGMYAGMGVNCPSRLLLLVNGGLFRAFTCAAEAREQHLPDIAMCKGLMRLRTRLGPRLVPTYPVAL